MPLGLTSANSARQGLPITAPAQGTTRIEPDFAARASPHFRPRARAGVILRGRGRELIAHAVLRLGECSGVLHLDFEGGPQPARSQRLFPPGSCRWRPCRARKFSHPPRSIALGDRPQRVVFDEDICADAGESAPPGRRTVPLPRVRAGVVMKADRFDEVGGQLPLLGQGVADLGMAQAQLLRAPGPPGPRGAQPFPARSRIPDPPPSPWPARRCPST